MATTNEVAVGATGWTNLGTAPMTVSTASTKPMGFVKIHITNGAAPLASSMVGHELGSGTPDRFMEIGGTDTVYARSLTGNATKVTVTR